MNYSDWITTVPAEIREDPLWSQEAYRLALSAADLGWHDVTRLFRDGRILDLASQLFASLGSIGGNISEGYSRGYSKDRARFYEYAPGSARESRTWYFDGRHLPGETVMAHRLQLHTQIIKLLLKMLPLTRGYSLHDGDSPGALIPADDSQPLSSVDLEKLLVFVPMPEP